MSFTKETRPKINKFEVKYKKEREKNSLLRKENKYFRRRTKDLAKSRDNHKAKSKDKGQEIKRLKHKINRKDKIGRHHYPYIIIFLGINLRLFCNCSYRSISKILALIGDCFDLGLSKYPCPNTIQNWVSKVGYFKLETLNKEELKGTQMTLIIDESIRIGQEKLLLVLGLCSEKIKAGALKFSDVSVLHMQAKTSWTGQGIKEVLELIQQKYGFEISNILSDEASTLKKACQLHKVPHLPEIMHALATCLRKTFQKDVDYQSFIKLIGGYQSKGVNQALTYLCPPKQRSKARFMNHYKVVEWANKLLMFFGKLNATERAFFKDLPKHYRMIWSLRACLLRYKNIACVFRNFGLSESTIEIVSQMIDEKVENDEYVHTFFGHIQSYLTQYEGFIKQQPNTTYHLSSEVIESLFGKFKEKAAYCKLTGLTNLNLELPGYSLDQNQLEPIIYSALEKTFMTDLAKWKQENSTDNQLVKRIKFFKNGT